MHAGDDQGAMTGLYLAHFSLHGLIRGDNLELGRNADTGGQITYVLGLARELARQEGVARVDLFTRLIQDRQVSEDYAQPIEEIGDNVRIVRIRCGGTQYRRKELLWPHLDEYIDKTLKFLRAEGLVPDLVHGHYPDAGYVAQQLSSFIGCPFVFTGHSLGRSKKDRLLNEGVPPEDVNKRYRIDERIAREEDILRHADLVVTSTRQEIREQWAQYHNAAPVRFEVIPPGLDLSRFVPYYHDEEGDIPEERMQARHAMRHELNRFLTSPDKPLILALCRPDARKNIAGLVHAYGSDRELQAIANLAIFAGIRKDISAMEDNEREVLTEMLLLMDRYDLYGKMAIPKRHDFSQEVPALYRLAASRYGVFVNPAFTEPFGLTLLEAGACGLPLVATDHGGPADIVANCRNGILVDVSDTASLADALREILVDRHRWMEMSRNGILKVREHYSWEAHCQHYLKAVRDLVGQRPRTQEAAPREVPVAKRLRKLERLLVSDIDGALHGDREGLETLGHLLADHRETLGFVVATGRPIESALEAIGELGLPVPDVLITSVGSQIYYQGPDFPDRGWTAHISVDWKREKVRAALAELDFLEPQSEENQRPYKLSYLMEDRPDLLARVHEHLAKRKLRYNLIYSYGQFLDVVAPRASKGKALRYLSYKWEIPLEAMLVAGGGGSDADMLVGECWGVVVANHSPELDRLQGRRRIYFSQGPAAAGILEGLRHFSFLAPAGNTNGRPPQEEAAVSAELVGDRA